MRTFIGVSLTRVIAIISAIPQRSLACFRGIIISWPGTASLWWIQVYLMSSLSRFLLLQHSLQWGYNGGTRRLLFQVSEQEFKWKSYRRSKRRFCFLFEKLYRSAQYVVDWIWNGVYILSTWSNLIVMCHFGVHFSTTSLSIYHWNKVGWLRRVATYKPTHLILSSHIWSLWIVFTDFAARCFSLSSPPSSITSPLTFNHDEA